MGKKSSKAPDARGAAEVEGRYARDTARDTTYADRPDQINPFGSVKWGTESVIDPAAQARLQAEDPGPYTGSTDGIGGKLGQIIHANKVKAYQKKVADASTTKWTQTQEYNPEIQRTLDNTLGFMGDRSELAAGMSGRIRDEMGGAPDWQQFGDVVGFDPTQQRQHAEDAAYGKATSRLDPRFEQRAQQLEVDLRNKGLRPGDQAYDAAMSSFGNERTDAYEQAQFGSVQQGRDEFNVALQGNERANALRDQSIQEYIAKRGFSLGEANALQEGQTATDLASMINGG